VRQPGVDAKAAITRFANTRAGTGGSKGWETSHPAPEEREYVMTAQLNATPRGQAAPPQAGDKPVKTAGPAPRNEPDIENLPPTAAGLAPDATVNPIGSLFGKIRKSLPVAASASASGQRDKP